MHKTRYFHLKTQNKTGLWGAGTALSAHPTFLVGSGHSIPCSFSWSTCIWRTRSLRDVVQYGHYSGGQIQQRWISPCLETDEL